MLFQRCCRGPPGLLQPTFPWQLSPHSMALTQLLLVWNITASLFPKRPAPRRDTTLGDSPKPAHPHSPSRPCWSDWIFASQACCCGLVKSDRVPPQSWLLFQLDEATAPWHKEPLSAKQTGLERPRTEGYELASRGPSPRMLTHTLICSSGGNAQ